MALSLPLPNIPRSIQLVVDDVGWREGWSLTESGGPSRAGVKRTFGPEDYATIANIGEAVGMRPQCAMVLCEWDKQNVCARVPTATQAGAAWDNSSRVGPWANEAARVFIEHGRHIELALHGVGHEHWDNGRPTRAEWVNGLAGRPWDQATLRAHLGCFQAILAQYGLDKSLPHGSPESFVPCAFLYYLNDGEPDSTGALMAKAGIRYASTPFGPSLKTPGSLPDRDGVFDSGLLLLDRGRNAVPFNAFARTPDRLPQTWICGVHWPNVVAEDPRENDKAAQLWIEYLRSVDREPDWMLAPNTAQSWSQWVFYHFARIYEDTEGWRIALSAVPARAWDEGFAQTFTVKFPLEFNERISGFRSEAFSVAGAIARQGYALVTLKPKDRQGGHVQWQLKRGPY